MPSTSPPTSVSSSDDEGRSDHALSYHVQKLLSRYPARRRRSETLELAVKSYDLESFSTVVSIDLSELGTLNVERVRTTWQAIASSNTLLRTHIVTAADAKKLSVADKGGPITFGRPSEESSRIIPAAKVYLTGSEESASLHFRIRRDVIDSSSLLQTLRNFLHFYHGEPLQLHPSASSLLPKSQRAEVAKIYWKQALDSLPSAPLYAFDFSGGDKRTETTSYLEETLVEQALEFSGSSGFSIHTLTCAAWASTLRWHTDCGSGSVAFITSSYEAESGPSPNSLYPLVVVIDEETSIDSWVRAISTQVATAGQNAFIGLEEIQKQAAHFAIQTAVAISDSTSTLESTNVPLKIILSLQSSRAFCRVSHGSSIAQEKVLTLMSHFLHALLSITSENTASVRDVTVIPVQEKSYLLEIGLPLTKPVDGLVHRLFEEQVVRTPQNPAIQFETEMPLTYNKVNCLANGIARQLDCGPGDYVPIYMHRSQNLPLAMLAVLKTGAAYVPMDPDVPHERNMFIIEDVGAKFILSNNELLGRFSIQIDFDKLVRKAPSYGQSNLNITQDFSDIVYVIYTSGSTGNPKGVLLEHHNAVSGLAAFPDIPDLRQLLFHNPIFSAAQRSVWSTLKQGGCLCLASKKNLTVFIGDTINTMNINTIDVTPSTALLITPGSVPCLKRMTVAGELINPALIPMWIDRLELLNAYGLSENTQFNWRNVIKKGQNPQNIGRPSDTTSAYVLIPGTIELSPLLVPGELCLGGHQLAREYLNRPEKTAVAFIKNPFGPGKLYRTGDMVVTYEDGSIEMIGRIDFQIKINDQRVEPGEANTILQMLPDIRECSVVSARVGLKRVLVGVIIPRDPSAWKVLIGEMKEALQARLPQYMIPIYWHPVEKLPLNVNGKVDLPSLSRTIESMSKTALVQGSAGAIELERFHVPDSPSHKSKQSDPATQDPSSEDEEGCDKSECSAEIDLSQTPGGNLALPAVDASQNDSGAAKSTEETAYKQQSLGESAMLTLLAETIDVPSELVDMSTDFIGLGGSSMEAIILSSRARNLGLDIEVSEIMVASSLGSLFEKALQKQAICLSEPRVAEAFSLLPAGASVDLSAYEDAYPPTQMQADLMAETLSEAANYDCYKAFALGGFDVSQFKAALTKVVEANSILRSSFVADGIGLLQVVQKSFEVPWENTDKTVAEVILASRAQPWIELGGPLIRAIETSGNSVVLILHHTLFDNWSTSFIHTDISRILTGMSPKIRPPFKNFVKHLEHTDFAKHEPFWKLYLENYRGNTLATTDVDANFYKTVELGVNMVEVARAFDVSVASLVYASWATSLARLTGDSDVSFLITFSGRDASMSQIIDLVGPTLSTAPIRVWVGPDVDVVDLAREIHDEIWALSSYANYGMRRIFKAANLSRKSINSLVNVMVRSDDNVICDVIKSLPVPPAPTNNNLTLEIDTWDSSRLHFMSRATYQDASALIDSMASIISTLAEAKELEPERPVRSQSRSSKLVPKSAHKSLGTSTEESSTPEQVESVKPWLNSETEPCILNTRPTRSVQSTSRSLTISPSVNVESIILGAVAIVLSVQTDLKDVALGMHTYQSENLTLKRFPNIREKTLANVLLAESTNTDTISISDAPGKIDTLISFGYSPPVKDFTILSVQSLGTWAQLTLCSSMASNRADYILDEICQAVFSITEEPDTPVNTYEVIGSRERLWLHELALSSDPAPQLLHHRFEDLSRTNPDRVALQWGPSITITYGELDHRSSALAEHLVSIGVKVGDMVPIMFEKSMLAIVSMLAIIKTGAAYIPISGDAPDERNMYILQDSGANFVVTQRAFEVFVNKTRVRPVYPDELHTNRPTNTPESPWLPPAPNDIAYCIYTSGSTGVPKGVMVPHASAAAAVGSMLEAEGRFEGDWRVLQFADYIFDASVQDIFNTLSSGGRLCMMEKDRMLSDLVEVINEMRVSHAILTPTVAETFTPKDVPTLKTLILGGELMTESVLKKWSSETKLLNVYGPTETSMVVSTKHIFPQTMRRNVGRPFRTVSAIILDPESNRLTPFGAVGELCISGPQVSTGYINQSDLTSKAYTKSVIPGRSIMYRTGDFARWLSNGEIELLGRTDGQVKISGNRVELDEVETAINQTNTAHGCVVQLIDVNSKPSLVAFIIFNDRGLALEEPRFQEPSTLVDECATLRERLTTLPAYMLPRYILPMNTFPKLPSQKTNRRALKAMGEALAGTDLSAFKFETIGIEASLEDRSVETEQEKALAVAFADMFRTPEAHIGASTSFIQMGGDSVAAINLASKIRKAGWSLSVKDVMNYGLLSDIAKRMKTRANQQTQALAKLEFEPPQQAISSLQEADLPLQAVDYWYPVPAGQAEFLSQGAKPDQLWVLMTVKPFPTSWSVDKWLHAVQSLTASSDILRSTFIKVPGNSWVAAVLKSSVPEFASIECHQNEKQIQIDLFWGKKFKFGRPYVKYLLLNYPDGQREIVVKMDHGLWDGTLFRLWDEQFTALIAGKTPLALESFQPFTTVHFNANKPRALEFWRKMVPEPKIWPSVEAPKITSFVTQQIDTKLEAVATSSNVTVPTVFQAIFQLWLAKKRGATAPYETSFDYLLTGRNVELPNPQAIDGNCANFLPFKITAPSDTTLAQYLQQTQGLFWEMTENGWVGLEDIYGSALGRDRNGNQVMFLFQPFEPAPAPTQGEDEEYVYIRLAKSKVVMYQPYALVVEIAKAASGHRMKVMFDERIFTSSAAQEIAGEINAMTEEIAKKGNGNPIGSYNS